MSDIESRSARSTCSPRPVPIRRVRRGSAATAGVGARDPLADAPAGRDAAAARVAARAGRPAPRLERELGRGPVAPRAVLAERRDRRPRRAQGARLRSAATSSAPGRPLSTTMSARAQRSSTSGSPGPPTTERFDVLRNSKSAPDTHAAHRVAAGRLDLDHVGARVREQLRAVGARDLGREVDDPQTVEHARSISSSSRQSSGRMLAHGLRVASEMSEAWPDGRDAKRVDPTSRLRPVRAAPLRDARRGADHAERARSSPRPRSTRSRSSRSRHATGPGPRSSRRSTGSRRSTTRTRRSLDDPDGRRRLQPAPERSARPVDDRRARGRQARAVREAVHGERGRGASRSPRWRLLTRSSS